MDLTYKMLEKPTILAEQSFSYLAAYLLANYQGIIGIFHRLSSNVNLKKTF